MALIRITVDTKQAVKDLLLLQQRLSNMLPAMRDIGRLAVASVRQNFTVGGRPRWAPLKNPRAEGRGGRGKILVQTGRLQSSIDAFPQRTSVTLSTDVPYAAIHQYGGTVHIPALTPRRARALSWVSADGRRVFAKRTRAHSVSIPARPFLVVQSSDEQAFGAVLTQYLLRGMS